MSDPLVGELARAWSEAQRAYRSCAGVDGCYTSEPIPDGLLRALAAVVVPVMRVAAAEAVADLYPGQQS